MKAKIKIIISLIITLLLILFLKTESKATENNNNETTEIKIIPTINTIEKGKKKQKEILQLCYNNITFVHQYCS